MVCVSQSALKFTMEKSTEKEKIRDTIENAFQTLPSKLHQWRSGTVFEAG